MHYCKLRAKEKGADIALFPEMWSNGYNIYDRPVDEWKKEAISIDSDFINAFGILAKQLKMAIGVTLHIAELDLKQLQEYRECEGFGNAYRHPQKYKLLTESKIEKPFT